MNTETMTISHATDAARSGALVGRRVVTGFNSSARIVGAHVCGNGTLRLTVLRGRTWDVYVPVSEGFLVLVAPPA